MLVCRFTGWLVGWFDDLPVCPLAKLEVCMDMNIMFQNIVFKSVFTATKWADTCIQSSEEDQRNEIHLRYIERSI